MALQLPQQPNDLHVALPQAPTNPPGLADVYSAVKLKHNVLDSAGECSVYHTPFHLLLPCHPL